MERDPGRRPGGYTPMSADHLENLLPAKIIRPGLEGEEQPFDRGAQLIANPSDGKLQLLDNHLMKPLFFFQAHLVPSLYPLNTLSWRIRIRRIS
jgi:hypothetical protein